MTSLLCFSFFSSDSIALFFLPHLDSSLSWYLLFNVFFALFYSLLSTISILSLLPALSIFFLAQTHISFFCPHSNPGTQSPPKFVRLWESYIHVYPSLTSVSFWPTYFPDLHTFLTSFFSWPFQSTENHSDTILTLLFHCQLFSYLLGMFQSLEIIQWRHISFPKKLKNDPIHETTSFLPSCSRSYIVY